MSRGLVQAEAAGVVDGDVAQGGAGAERQLLPGDQVGVVLHFGDHNLVARFQGEVLQPGITPALGSPQRRVGERIADQVQALGGVGGPDGFLVVGAHEVGEGLAGVLEDLRGLDGKVVGAAVHGGVALFVELLLGFDHAERVLRRGPGIKVDQRLAVDQSGSARGSRCGSAAPRRCPWPAGHVPAWLALLLRPKRTP